MSEPCVVEFCFDYASPWSYLAESRIEKALEGLPVQIQRIPVYLRGFEMFRSAMPFPPAKLAYIMKDLQRFASLYDIPIKTPANFPINGLYLLRGTLSLEECPEWDTYRQAAFRATWADDRNVSDPGTAIEIAVESGLDREKFSAGIASPAIKEKLKANTERTVARGAFGVPTFFVGDEIFWGQDRLDFVRREVERAC